MIDIDVMYIEKIKHIRVQYNIIGIIPTHGTLQNII